MITVQVSNTIQITGLDVQYSNALKKALTIPNLEFAKFQNMGIWAPRDFKYWKEPKDQPGVLEIPRGTHTRLLSYLDASKVAYELVDGSVDKYAFQGYERQKTVVLRDFQKAIVDKIVASRPSEGIIVSSTGSGKTVIGLEIIHKFSLSATILVTNSVLLDQFISEAEKFYGLKAARIDGKSKEIGNLTVSTFQSLMRNDELLQRLAEHTSLLIIDEVQGIVSKEREKVLKAFAPKHLLGLTATPSREGSLTPAIFFLCGHPLVDHQMAQAQPEIEVVRTGVPIPMGDSYHRIIDSMVENHSRNKLIAGLVLGEMLQGRKILVLTKRIQHYENLKHFFTNFNGLYFIDSDDANRNDLLGKFKSGVQDFNCLFGTTSLLAVGVDIPILDTIILACDLKSSVLTTQSIGRALRLFEGKPTPKIIDLYDNQNPILASQFSERLKLYKAKGWEIEHYFKCPKCKKVFTYYKKEYLIHNKICYGN